MIETIRNITCPHCNKDIQLQTYVEHNVVSYNKAVLAKTECCGLPVIVTPIRGIRVSTYQGNCDKDDWGQKFKTIESSSCIICHGTGYDKGTKCICND